jgi:hypothetical protein
MSQTLCFCLLDPRACAQPWPCILRCWKPSEGSFITLCYSTVGSIHGKKHCRYCPKVVTLRTLSLADRSCSDEPVTKNKTQQKPARTNQWLTTLCQDNKQSVLQLAQSTNEHNTQIWTSRHNGCGWLHHANTNMIMTTHLKQSVEPRVNTPQNTQCWTPCHHDDDDDDDDDGRFLACEDCRKVKVLVRNT